MASREPKLAVGPTLTQSHQGMGSARGGSRSILQGCHTAVTKIGALMKRSDGDWFPGVSFGEESAPCMEAHLDGHFTVMLPGPTPNAQCICERHLKEQLWPYPRTQKSFSTI